MNLADPELELIDPTPNVYSMFLNFDKTFFWDSLSSRCIVRWSKRMYSCAGVCSYEGRGGLCDIALSEPLLKLRPRKDLVETLLHEMIHAYLFVMRRDQDRDGHGPNFQAHMHRINRAAGLNISIYHDFHDEVELYQTHWWRCNGPCQLRRPHFGIVRRTNNRAPGPSEWWWNNHLRYCGGTFIKIKEPDKPEKRGKKNNVAKTNADITKYINNNNNNKAVSNKNIYNDKTKKTVLKDFTNVPVNPKIGIKSNNISTLVITKNNFVFKPEVPKSKSVNLNDKVLLPDTGQPNKGDRKRTSSTGVLETVRNVWANKQINTSNNKISTYNNSTIASNPNKHKVNEHAESPPSKIKKIDEYFKTTATSVLKDLYGQDFNITQSKGDQKLKAMVKNNSLVDCPVCNTKIDSDEINRHLDECLNKSVIEKLTKESIPTVKNELKVDCNQINGSQSQDTANIKICDGAFKKEAILQDKKDNKNHNRTSSVSITTHITNTDNDVCQKRLRKSLDQVNFEINKQLKGKIDNKNHNSRKSDGFNESTASNMVCNVARNDNFGNILPKQAEMEPSCSTSNSTLGIACPCCGDILNQTIDDHLDECLSFFENNTTIPEEGASNPFINGTIVIDDDDDEFDESQTFNVTGTKLPCPCCLKMVEEIDMNNHLDKCLS